VAHWNGSPQTVHSSAAVGAGDAGAEALGDVGARVADGVADREAVAEGLGGAPVDGAAVGGEAVGDAVGATDPDGGSCRVGMLLADGVVEPQAVTRKAAARTRVAPRGTA
jgi:hypothetical protein